MSDLAQSGLCGEKVLGLLHELGGLYVEFSGGWNLAIFNDQATRRDQWESSIGQTVVRLDDFDDHALFTLSDGTAIAVSLKDEDYVGPEAMALHGPNDVIVIWN